MNTKSIEKRMREAFVFAQGSMKLLVQFDTDEEVEYALEFKKGKKGSAVVHPVTEEEVKAMREKRTPVT